MSGCLPSYYGCEDALSQSGARNAIAAVAEMQYDSVEQCQGCRVASTVESSIHLGIIGSNLICHGDLS